jgi:resolvase domain protein
MKNEAKRTFRCAIYTRKSIAEGLEKDFNTLDAQREAAENYIASQKHEGWVAIPKHYDDGGFTGGNMERPALRELFEDIKKGEIDIVIVYKVDRLSRSITDFAKIVELFEAHNVSFVSVTQHFNTKDSMGRLTLNILLSFAQFERELISERTKDKMSAARKKGKWLGGRPILGYDIVKGGGAIEINRAEAETVNFIFDTYFETRSALKTLEILNARGIRNKEWRTRSGSISGGSQFTKTTLYGLLKNYAYIGKLKYDGKIYDAEFDGIVSEEKFLAVRSMMKNNFTDRMTARVRTKSEGLLSGKLYCSHCGRLMGHTYSRKTKNKIYRYYVCMNAQKSGWKNCPHPSLPADVVEKFVVGEISAVSSDATLAKQVMDCFVSETEKELSEMLKRREKVSNALDNKRALIGDAAQDSAEYADLIKAEMSHSEALQSCDTSIKTLRERLKFSREELARIFGNFDEIWVKLNFKEKYELVDLLVERVTFYGESGELGITYRECGIKTKDNNGN